MNKELEEKKEHLKGYAKALRQLRRSEERLREIRSNCLGGAIKLDGMPHAHNSTDLSAYAAALDAEEQSYKEILQISTAIRNEILKAIEELSSEEEKEVLTYRYISLMKWEEVCEKVGRSWKQIHRIHGRGLRNIKIELAQDQRV